MDAINIILEFESPDRDLINQDIYSEERGCVDFSILIPYPIELDTLISGSSEDTAIKLVKEHCKEFNIESLTLLEDIKQFIKKYAEHEYFLSDERLTEETLESIKNSIIAYQKYGYANWRDFKIDKWSVSQNAFVYANGKKKRTSTGGFYFVTGWVIPKKWLLALSEKWKDVNFKVYGRMEFANRQGNVTEYNFLNGKCKMIGDVKRKF
jgi:hypothetical protein